MKKRVIVSAEFLIEFDFEEENHPGQMPEQVASGMVDNYEELLNNGDEEVTIIVHEAREDTSKRCGYCGDVDDGTFIWMKDDKAWQCIMCQNGR